MPMAKIISNKKLSDDFYLMKVEENNSATMGQFYMLRAWKDFPVLSRPISVYDADEHSISFLYKVVGKGTEIFVNLKHGDDISLQGPLGNGFPDAQGKIALVGGGVGIAPLYLTAKTLMKNNPDNIIDIYLGFSDQVVLIEEFDKVSRELIVDVGGYITDNINPSDYDYIFTCGPEIMMKVLYEKCNAVQQTKNLYVSLENRMACGIGACLVCTCKNKSGNKKACKDGPVFASEEVFGK
jgi:dihydroorotate dehydrogenase electron transfer subunit